MPTILDLISAGGPGSGPRPGGGKGDDSDGVKNFAVKGAEVAISKGVYYDVDDVAHKSDVISATVKIKGETPQRLTFDVFQNKDGDYEAYDAENTQGYYGTKADVLDDVKTHIQEFVQFARGRSKR
jgi:hypothetical protein